MSAAREWGADLARFYTVTDPQRHPRGHTVYKVTARVVSRRNPEDVQEIIVWKRYSDFKKLHKELWQIHKNLFRQSELFPPFAKGKVFGRFDATVVEERRQCAEDLLQFSANIPALYSSRQLSDFFKGGVTREGSELIGPVEDSLDTLVDSLGECSTEGCSSDSDRLSLAELDDGMASRQDSPGPRHLAELPALGAVAPVSELGRVEEERVARSRFPGSLRSRLGRRDYLEKAGELIQLALKKEEEDDYAAASRFYRKAVDLLLEGVQGESNPIRREAVKRRTAEYLLRAESLSSLQAQTPPDAMSQPPGSVSSRPPGSQSSPAEELKAFRVLGVIDKVLLVMDTRTEQTFILKGLRKSSAAGGSRRTIVPRCVPHMVRLHKYIVSDESVFLVLQHAEGGKLWSYVGRFLSRSPEDTLAAEAVRIHSPRDMPESSPQATGSLAVPLPLRASLTPSSQDGSQRDEEDEEEEEEEEEDELEEEDDDDEDGRVSSLKWSESGSSSEEGCTSSYSTLCNEYGREKVEAASLAEEPLPQPKGSCPKSLTADPWPDTPPGDPEFRFFSRVGDLDTALPVARSSLMGLFRINSQDSAGECGDRPECLPLSLPDGGSWDTADSVPVISFKDAALGDGLVADEGRPDLLVNLPAGLGAVRAAAAAGPVPCLAPSAGTGENILLGAPDVLCLSSSPEPCGASEEEGAEEAQQRTEGLPAPGVPLTGTARDQGSEEGSQADSDPLQTEAVLLFAEHVPSSEAAVGGLGLSPQDSGTAAESWGALAGDGDIHQIFEALDKRLALRAGFSVPEGCVQRWAAEMVVALDALHREGIVCRDLNPNNILLNDRGHIQLTYFSRWSEVEDPCDSDAMERLYCAPEVGAITEETEACDWWSLGAVLFELLTGKTLLECHPAGISTHTTVDVPGSVSEEARSLVQQLLQFNPVERLGAGVAGVEDIKSHPFFTPVDWAALTG